MRRIYLSHPYHGQPENIARALRWMAHLEGRSFAMKNGVRIPRPIRKAVKLALVVTEEDHVCASCKTPYSLEPDGEMTSCCNSCAQTLLVMVASYVECLRTGRKYE